jgi:hypothetical protein
MEKSNSIKNIAGALFKFHAIVQSISKDAKNPAFKKDGKVSKYASLSNIQDAIRQPLHDAGLVYLQMPEMGHTMATMLMHPESGEYIQGIYDLTPVSNTPQAVGSAITYARRYALAAALGLTIDDDDDGNAASGATEQQQQIKQTPAAASNKIELLPNSENWSKVLKYCADNKGWTMQQLEKKYTISQAVKKQLIEATLQPA